MAYCITIYRKLKWGVLPCRVEKWVENRVMRVGAVGQLISLAINIYKSGMTVNSDETFLSFNSLH
jgi:hypothetical protein